MLNFQLGGAIDRHPPKLLLTQKSMTAGYYGIYKEFIHTLDDPAALRRGTNDDGENPELCAEEFSTAAAETRKKVGGEARSRRAAYSRRAEGLAARRPFFLAC